MKKDELDLTKELLDTVVTTANIGYFVHDLTNDHVIYSDIAKEIFTLEQLKEEKYQQGSRALFTLLLDLTASQDRATIVNAIKTARYPIEQTELEVKLISPNQQERHIKLITNHKYCNENRLIRTLGTVYDLTELKIQQYQHAELSKLIESSLNEVYVIDTVTLKYLYANQNALDTLGYTLNQLQQKAFFEINSDLNEDLFDTLYSGDDQSAVFESDHVCRDGSQYPVRSQLHHANYFGRKNYLIYSSDISKERQNIINNKTLISTLSTVLDFSSNMYLLSNGNRIVYANNTLLEKLGLDSFKAFSRTYSSFLAIFDEKEEYFPITLKSFECQSCSCILERITTNQYAYISHPTTQETIAVKLSFKELPNGFFLIEMNDITELKAHSERFKYQAYHDKLTGIYNRNFFEKSYDGHLHNLRAQNIDCSLILFDLDDFKGVNDCYGHLTGDRILVTMSDTIKKNIREDDIFVRWGGEEFAIILTQTPFDHALHIAEALRQEINNTDFEISRDITASFGVSSCQGDDDKTSLFERLDRALYLAKSEGKNCVRAL